ncbi:MAG: hypothetical protein Q4F77_00190 [Acinetobacter sp.]|uniref:hypothetical protein n=1 Tax=Acinetobacter sp. TaxID=472 RepID=UPI0026E1013E|nr:hypothetical protein [Acinetobacter sp.]MDO5541701.1 hypothetical protein [Acinetobacter sp.]
MSKEKQDDWKRTQIRIPVGLYEDVVQYAEKHNLSLNTAMLELMDLGLKSKEEGKSGRSIYFNDLNCVEDVRQVPLVKQQENLTAKISQLFSENPQYQLINIETLNNGEKIRYWYSIPRSESFRD